MTRLSERRTPAGRFYRWPCPGASVRLGRARSGRKRGFIPHLASASSGRFHHWIKGAGEWPFIPCFGADLVVAMAPVNGRVSSRPPVLLVAAGSAGHAEPQASDRTCVSAEATVTPGTGIGDHHARVYENA